MKQTLPLSLPSNLRASVLTRPPMTLRQRKRLLASIPLEFKWKALSFLFPGLIQALKLRKYVSFGYERRAMELLKWTWYGVNFYNSLIAIVAIYQALFNW